MFPFAGSTLQKFKPKEIKFSQFYKRSNKKDTFSDSAKNEIKGALKAAGLGQAKINRIINEDQPAGIGELKSVVEHLNKQKVSGFDSSPRRLVNDYLRHEAVKNKNISRIKHQYMVESRSENLRPGEPASGKKQKINLPF